MGTPFLTVPKLSLPKLTLPHVAVAGIAAILLFVLFGALVLPPTRTTPG